MNPHPNITQGSQSTRPGRLFAYSASDVYLVLVAVFGVGWLALSAIAWTRSSPPLLAVLWLCQVLLLCTNYQCVAHNFVHNEFFSSRCANHAMSMLNSVALC